MKKYMYDIICVCFKLSKLNFLQYCIFNTMRYHVRIPIRENSDHKRVIRFLALGCKRKERTLKSERKLLGNFAKCPLSMHWF